MIFNFDISIPVAVLLVCCFVTALTAAMAGLRPMRKVARIGRRATSPERIEDEVGDRIRKKCRRAYQIVPHRITTTGLYRI